MLGRQQLKVVQLAISQATKSRACLALRINNVHFTRSYCCPPPPTLKPDITFEEVKKNIDTREYFVVDVRTPEEVETLGIIPGSIHLDLRSFGHRMLLPKEDFEVRVGVKKPAATDPIVTVCKMGIRARTAQMALLGIGYTNVRRYKGSFDEWTEKGGPIIKASKEDLD